MSAEADASTTTKSDGGNAADGKNGRGGSHHWIFIGIVAGAIIGSILNSQYIEEVRTQVLGANYTQSDLHAHGKEVSDALVVAIKDTALGAALNGIGRLFMNLLKMIVIPLVFFSLVMGVLGMSGSGSVGRIGLKTAVWYICTSLVSIITGLLTVNILAPGDGASITIPTAAREAVPPGSVWDVLVGLVPSNIVKAAANFDMFGIIFFAILCGAFLLSLEDEKRELTARLVDAWAEMMMRMTEWVISLAPVGIAGLVGYTVATSGPKVFLSLLPFVATVAVALGIHFCINLPIMVWVLTKRSPYRYMRAMTPALLTGFSTASSAGTLAVTIDAATEDAGISRRISSFVLPLGATVNMDGTALFECVTVLFIAQVHASTHPEFAPLTVMAQIMVVMLALAVSIGAAGIPHAGLVMMVIILNAVNLPLEYTALVWSVDRVLDMARTMTNIWSDSCGALVVAHSEGEIDGARLFD